jgi:hypothetical protein
MRKRRAVFFLGFLFALLIVAGAANADTITLNSNISFTTTDWSNSLSFAQFNSSLGTLTGVSLVLNSTIYTTLTVTNNAGSASSGNAYTQVNVTVTGLTINPLTNNAFLGGIWTSPYAYNLGAGGSTTSGILTGTATSSNSYSTNLSQFIGAGNILLPASTYTQTVLQNNGGNTTAGQSTTADLSGILTYTYTSVPVPSTVLLLGPAFFGLAAIRKRFTR